MQKVIHIQKIEDQDKNRRKEISELRPDERMQLLIRYRDQAFTKLPLKRVIQVRDVSIG